jgi:LysM repeat protein
MIHKTLISLIFIFSGTSLFASVAGKSEDQLNYIDRYKKIAIEEMERTGVPASIKLAQGLLESGAGKSYLATEGNNHFGIKCGSSWDGKTLALKDDDKDKNGKLIHSCFRVYKNPEESFRAHSDFLRDPNKDYRYGWLFDLKTTDYKGWAYGLKKSGYATNPQYPKLLISLIERYNLNKFDKLSSIEVDFTDEQYTDSPIAIPEELEAISFLTMKNKVKMVYAKEDESIATISDKYKVSTKRLLSFNENEYNTDEILEKGTIVYLQRKRTYYRGSRKWHYVKDGETMFTIAQLYGVQLEKLYEKNLLQEGQEPLVGEKVKLRGKISDPNDAPKIHSTTEVVAEEKEESDFIWEPERKVNIEEDNELAELDELNNIDEQDEELPVDKPDLKEEELPSDKPKSEEEDNSDETSSELDPITLPDVNEDLPKSEDERRIADELPQSDSVNTHIVQKGDTLYSLSRKYDLTVTELKTLNNLTDNIISIGQKLKVSK